MRVFVLAAFVSLAGCAAQTQRPSAPPPPPPAKVDTKTPRCDDQLQCRKMWLEAQEVIQELTRMRLRLVTDDRLETFAATRPGSMTGTVVKYPLGGDSFEIRAQFQCYRGVYCWDLAANATNLFNLQIGAITGNLVTAPAPSARAQETSLTTSSSNTPTTPQVGQEIHTVQRLAKQQACHETPTPKLVAKGPGFESYSVACTNGNVLMYRCEYGNCRALR